MDRLNQLCFPENLQQFLPYVHKQALQSRNVASPAAKRAAANNVLPTKDASVSPYVIYDPLAEYTRLGLLTKNEVHALCSRETVLDDTLMFNPYPLKGAGDGGAWRLSSANAEYALSETYPR